MAKRKLGTFEEQKGMTAYTEWWVAHPWHVTGTLESGKVPPDCDCEGCAEKRKEGEPCHQS